MKHGISFDLVARLRKIVRSRRDDHVGFVSSSNKSLMILIVLSDESRARNPARNAGDETFSRTRITSSHLPLR